MKYFLNIDCFFPIRSNGFKKAYVDKRTLRSAAHNKISTRPTVLHIAQVAEEASTHPPFIPEAPK